MLHKAIIYCGVKELSDILYGCDGSSLSNRKCLCSQDEVKENLLSLPELMSRASKPQTMFAAVLWCSLDLFCPLFCPSGRAIEGSTRGAAAHSLALPEFRRVSPERLFCRKLETCVQLQMKCPCCGENLGHCDPILVMHSAEPCTWLCCWVTLLKSLCHSGHLFPAPCPANRTGLLLHYR